MLSRRSKFSCQFCLFSNGKKAKRTTGSICICNKFYQHLFVLKIIKVVDKCNGAYRGCDKKVASLLSLPVRKLCNFVHKWNRLAKRTRESSTTTTTTLTQIIINFALREQKRIAIKSTKSYANVIGGHGISNGNRENWPGRPFAWLLAWKVLNYYRCKWSEVK